MGKSKIVLQKVDGFTPDECRQNKALVRYQEIKGHWIFDINMDEKFTRKAQFVAGGHMTKPPLSMTFCTVVTRESVRMAFLLTGLNELDAMLSQTMIDMKYNQYKADNDVWYRPAVKPNGFEYYEYVLISVDNIINISHDTKATM